MDEVSLKIVDQLYHDGRCSIVKLAKTLGVSEVTVAKKIDYLIGSEIITISAFPNPYKIGYNIQAFIGMCVDLKSVDYICSQLKDNLHIPVVTTCFGRFNILLIVIFPDLPTFQDFVTKILPRIKGVNSIETSIIQVDIDTNSGDGKIKSIDEIDIQIIRELIKNGRANYADLANKIGVSTPTISRRIASLIKDKIITIRAIPTPSSLGYSISAMVGVRAELNKIDRIYTQLSGFKEIGMIIRLTNNFDFVFHVLSTNPDKLGDFLSKKIANINGILNIETFICNKHINKIDNYPKNKIINYPKF